MEFSDKHAEWVQSRTPAAWGLISSFGVLLSVLLTTVLVSLLIGDHTWWAHFAFGLLALVVLALTAVLTSKTAKIRDARFPDNPDLILALWHRLTRCLQAENEREHRLAATEPSSPDSIRATALENIKELLVGLESTLSHHWSTAKYGGSGVAEAVIMKRAADGRVTVATWGHVKPISLDQRSTNTDLYEHTEAAQLYRQFIDSRTRAPIHIIEDVASSASYDHLGRSETSRTKSTCLFPIYSRNSDFYGFVAITSRTQAGAFHEKQRKFWTETWTTLEPHFVRSIRRFESTGTLLAEQLP